MPRIGKAVRKVEPVSGRILRNSGILQIAGGDFQLAATLRTRICNSEKIAEFKKAPRWRASGRQQPKYIKRSDWLAGAPGFEPGNGGIKIRCLTTWLRPNKCRRTAANYPRARRPDHSGANPPNQRPLLLYIKRGLTGQQPRLD